MKSVIGCIALILGVASMAVQAADDGPDEALIYVGTMGATYGGDTIYSAYDVNGYRSRLNAGSLLQFGLGALWQPSSLPVALQLTLNWQNDDLQYNCFYSGKLDNGFNRFPIELIGYYTPTPDFRIGIGRRFVKSPSAYVNASDVTEKLRFDNSIGQVFEIGYQIAHGANETWLNLRYVSERYQPYTLTQNGGSVSVAGSPSINGSHIGINVVVNLESAFGHSGSASTSSNIQEPEYQSNYQSGSLYLAPEHEHEHEHEHRTESVKREVVLIPGKPDNKSHAKSDDDKNKDK